MSRKDYPATAQTALDRFDVPPLSVGFADRVVAAAVASGAVMPPLGLRAAPRRDRRGIWRRAGQAAFGIAAVGMMSAAAVASGLLGAVGIEVPVLSAMLAPQPVKKPATVVKPQAKLAERAATRPAVTETPAPPPVIAPTPEPASRAQIIEARRAMRRATFQAERDAFLNKHPGLREAIAAGPEARKAFMKANPDVRADVRTRIAEMRARKAAARAAIVGLERARLEDPVTSAAARLIDPAVAERRAARRAEWDALDPAQRAARIEAFKARRAARLERLRAQAAPIAPEGSAPAAR